MKIQDALDLHLKEEASRIIGEPEQALAAAGFLSEVREIHHVYEREADAYGYAYIAKKGIAIDCLRLYHKIAGDEPVSTDKHDPIEERCRGR